MQSYGRDGGLRRYKDAVGRPRARHVRTDLHVLHAHNNLWLNCISAALPMGTISGNEELSSSDRNAVLVYYHPCTPRCRPVISYIAKLRWL